MELLAAARLDACLVHAEGVALGEGVDGRAGAEPVRGHVLFLLVLVLLGALVGLEGLAREQHDASQVLQHRLHALVVGHDHREVAASAPPLFVLPDSASEAVEQRANGGALALCLEQSEVHAVAGAPVEVVALGEAGEEVEGGGEGVFEQQVVLVLVLVIISFCFCLSVFDHLFIGRNADLNTSVFCLTLLGSIVKSWPGLAKGLDLETSAGNPFTLQIIYH